MSNKEKQQQQKRQQPQPQQQPDSILRHDADANAVLLRSAATGASFWTFIEARPPAPPRRRAPPERRSFPAQLRTFSFRPSPDGCDANLLVLLHGLGDSHEPFLRLGETLALPQTAVLALRAPFPLPLDLGHGWFEAIDLQRGGDVIRPDRHETRRSDSLDECLGLLERMLAGLLAGGDGGGENGNQSGGWRPEEVMLLGFSQGGTVALEWALRRHRRRAAPFAGAVAVAAGLLEERRWWTRRSDEAFDGPPAAAATPDDERGGGGRKTPCLVVAGESDDVCPLAWVRQSAEIYNRGKGGAGAREVADCCVEAIPGKRHGMLGEGFHPVGGSSKGLSGTARRARDREMAAVMAFFAAHLQRRSQLEDQADVYEVVGSSPS